MSISGFVSIPLSLIVYPTVSNRLGILRCYLSHLLARCSSSVRADAVLGVCPGLGSADLGFTRGNNVSEGNLAYIYVSGVIHHIE